MDASHPAQYSPNFSRIFIVSLLPFSIISAMDVSSEIWIDLDFGNDNLALYGA